jgi:hypothetical protein
MLEDQKALVAQFQKALVAQLAYKMNHEYTEQVRLDKIAKRQADVVRDLTAKWHAAKTKLKKMKNL